MAKIDDVLGTLETELAGATTRIQEDVANYEARIAALEAKPELTVEQEARLEALRAAPAAIDPTNPNVLPPA